MIYGRESSAREIVHAGNHARYVNRRDALLIRRAILSRDHFANTYVFTVRYTVMILSRDRSLRGQTLAMRKKKEKGSARTRTASRARVVAAATRAVERCG